jgi:FkbM family methyltransferase
MGVNMRYVDIGGFDGDTVRSLKAIPGALSAIVSFEPDPANYDKLWREVSNLCIEESIALPLALSDKLEILSFDANSDSSASLSSAGQVKVQAASFDTLLPNWRPTHIKMDVEGAEPQVIEGMLKSIERNRPALAISVYHEPRHHWAIQQRIQQLNLDYRFFLRSYAFQTFETVLYCIPEETVLK